MANIKTQLPRKIGRVHAFHLHSLSICQGDTGFKMAILPLWDRLSELQQTGEVTASLSREMQS